MLKVWSYPTVAVASIAVAIAAFGATQATGEATSAPGAVLPAARADAYLATTSRALASMGLTASSITLAATTGGYEVYAVKGPSVVCLLAAGTTQTPGRLTQLSCADRKGADVPNAPMVTQLHTTSGLADLVWRPDGATALQATVGKSSAETISGSNAAIVLRPTGEAGSLSWKTASGERSTVSLPSAATLKAEAVKGAPTG